MTDFLVKLFVKDYKDVKNKLVVKRYGFLCGFVGIITNTLLSILKIMLGLAANSIAVTADAVNNLSDVGASVVTLVGFYFVGKPADQEHPFGHGRAEYLSALFLSLMVIMVGIQFLKTSWLRVINPQPIVASWLSVGLLLMSIGLKIWQSRLYKKIGQIIHSKTLTAAALDSLSDVATTAIVVLSLIISKFTIFPLDAYIGLIVSLLIIYNGWNIIKDVIDPILGTMPDEEQIKEITDLILCCEGIRGYHDLIIHNYGAGTILATVHCEVSDQLGLLEAHDIIDCAEKRVARDLGINILIHLDPISFDDPKITKIFDEIKHFARTLDEDIDIHDFRLVQKFDSEIIFDMVVPIRFSQEVIDATKKKVIEFIDKQYDVQKVFITIERGNIIV